MEKIDAYINQNAVTKETWVDSDGIMHIRSTQDIEPVIEYANHLRNDPGYFKAGIKKNWAHAGTIPAVVVLELRQLGIDVNRAPLKTIKEGLRKLGKEHFIWGS